jgi:Holliday junction DNA helicase RuvA
VIASVHGQVTSLGKNSIVVEVGGVGLLIFVPAPLKDRLRVGERLRLFTHLVVRQDALALYGFETQEELTIFSLLLGVNGVGPRSALAVLSTLSTEAVRRAVIHEQVEVFSRVPGIGRKTAQNILLSLQDHIKPGLDELGETIMMKDVDGEVLSALTALGYSVVEAQAALQALPKDAPEELEERLRMALQSLSL